MNARIDPSCEPNGSPLRGTRRPQVVIVGAGIAGLTAARLLPPGFDVVILDKGRGVGGRLATRRMGDATFDHGAQFLTARTDAFTGTVDDLLDGGVVRPWFDGRPDGDRPSDGEGHTRFCGTVSMNAIAKHLAAGLDVRTATLVETLVHDGDRWAVRLADGTALEADAVVATAPVPQTLALLSNGDVDLSVSDRAALDAIEYDPCLALMVALDGPSGIAAPGAVRRSDGPIKWMADNQAKGVSTSPAVTIHACADFSRQRWDDDLDAIVGELLDAAALHSSPLSDGVQLQRWRYARPSTTSEEPCRVLTGLPPIVCAGDAFGGPRVEGAAISGAAAAAVLIDAFGGQPN